MNSWMDIRHPDALSQDVMVQSLSADRVYLKPNQQTFGVDRSQELKCEHQDDHLMNPSPIRS